MDLIYNVKNDCNYLNINDVIFNEFKISNRLFSKLINTNSIFLNDKNVDTRNRISFGDTVRINFDYIEDNSNIVPLNWDLSILYEDEWLLVVNKPAGIAIHPSILHYDNSLSNAVKYYFDRINLKKKIRVINRLDKDTSGIVIFAKCEYIQECFIRQMNNKIFKKYYYCLSSGNITPSSGILDFPIARKENSIIERCVQDEGKRSITHFKVLKYFDDFCLVECCLETGRTHQIRVHFSHIGHPLLGDTLYGNSDDNSFVSRQALHCGKITLLHPITNKELTFTAKCTDIQFFNTFL